MEIEMETNPTKKMKCCHVADEQKKSTAKNSKEKGDWT